MTEPLLFSHPYSRSSAWRRPLRRLAAVALAGVALSACSLRLPLGGLGLQSADPQETGSIAPIAAPIGNVDAAPLPALASEQSKTVASPATAFAADTGAAGAAFAPADWVYARGALGLALSGTTGGPPVPWANPETGTYGSFAPAAATTAAGDCRAFVAERVKTGSTQRFAGRACKGNGGAWVIAQLSREPDTAPKAF
jgi:surface antigen